MGLRSALVDRARVLGTAQTNYRVQGMTIVEPTIGPWFRCRLTLPEASADTSQKRARTVRHPTLLYGTTDSAKQPIVLTTDERVEVDSPELGRAIWLVESDPAPLRKKRKVLGYETHLKLTDEHVAERDHATRSPLGVSIEFGYSVEVIEQVLV